MLTKDMIKKLNELAQEDFNRARAMLDGVNMLAGGLYSWSNYGYPNIRVVISSDISTLESRIATMRDAYTCAKD